jgi:DNA repair exonuclease SbcCD ATPase subunit
VKLLTKKMREIAPVIAKSVEEEYSSLQTELTLATSKLSELKEEFSQRTIKSVPLHEFQEMSSELSRQELIVDQLQQQFTEVETRLGEKRRKDALDFDRQRQNTRRGELLVSLQQMDARLDKARTLVKQTQEQMEILLPERNRLLAELASIPSLNGVN